MSKKLPQINSLAAVGALIGVGIGVISRSRTITTLILGAALAAAGNYIQKKFE